MAVPDFARTRNGLRLVVLAAAACGTGPARAEEPLPRHAIARIGDYRFHHGPGVSAAISPDGNRVASVASDHLALLRGDATRDQVDESRVVVLWDAATGERVREWRVPHAPAARPRFSPDGKRLMVSYGRGDGRSGVAVYDVATGELRTHLDKPPHRLRASGFTPDGTGLLFHDQLRGTGVVWDLATAKEGRTWKCLEGPSEWVKGGEQVCETIPSADAGYLASLIDVPPTIDVIPPLGEPLPPHVPRPTVLVVSEGATGKPLYRKEFPDYRLGRFAFSADGRRFATGGNKVTVYETATGKELFALAAGSPYAFALSPDGRWAVTHSGASQVRLWDLRTRAVAQDMLPGLAYAPKWAEFSADGAAVVVATGAALRVFDTAAAERLGPRHRTGVEVRFAPDGKTLFTTCAELRQRWDVSAAKQPALLRSEPRRAWEGVCGNLAVAHSPDGRLFVDELERRLRVRDTATGRVVHTLEDDGWRGSFGVFSPDGTRLALRRYPPARTSDGGVTTGNDPEVMRLYDPATGRKTGDVVLKDGPSWVVPAFSADGTTLAWADRAGDVHLHDAATGRRVRTLRSEKPLADGGCSDADVLFSPGGGHVVVSAYRHPVLGRPGDPDWVTLPTRVFDVATGKEAARFYANPTATTKGQRQSCAAASRDGRLLAVAEQGSGAVRVLDTSTGTARAEFAGHRLGVRSLAFAPDGKTLASGGEDGVAYLWDVSDLTRKDGTGK